MWFIPRLIAGSKTKNPPESGHKETATRRRVSVTRDGGAMHWICWGSSKDRLGHAHSMQFTQMSSSNKKISTAFCMCFVHLSDFRHYCRKSRFVQGDILSGYPVLFLRPDVAKGPGLMPLGGLLPSGTDEKPVDVRIGVWEGRQPHVRLRVVQTTDKLSRKGASQCSISSCKALGPLCDGMRRCG